MTDAELIAGSHSWRAPPWDYTPLARLLLPADSSGRIPVGQRAAIFCPNPCPRETPPPRREGRETLRGAAHSYRIGLNRCGGHDGPLSPSCVMRHAEGPRAAPPGLRPATILRDLVSQVGQGGPRLGEQMSQLGGLVVGVAP